MYAHSSHSTFAIGVVVMVMALNQLHVLLHEQFLNKVQRARRLLSLVSLNELVESNSKQEHDSLSRRRIRGIFTQQD